jgi:hypothetical protein
MLQGRESSLSPFGIESRIRYLPARRLTIRLTATAVSGQFCKVFTNPYCKYRRNDVLYWGVKLENVGVVLFIISTVKMDTARQFTVSLT